MMSSLIEQRKHLRYKLRSIRDDGKKTVTKMEIADLTTKIGTLRKEVILCNHIAERSEVIKKKLKVVHADERKEQSQIEHRRRSSRSSH